MTGIPYHKRKRNLHHGCDCEGCKRGGRCVARKRTKLCTNRVSDGNVSYPCGAEKACNECKRRRQV